MFLMTSISELLIMDFLLLMVTLVEVLVVTLCDTCPTKLEVTLRTFDVVYLYWFISKRAMMIFSFECTI